MSIKIAAFLDMKQIICLLLFFLSLNSTADELSTIDFSYDDFSKIDHRLPITTDEFRFVGKVFFKGSRLDYPCSGVLVDSNLVLTNRHCVWGRNKDKIFFSPDPSKISNIENHKLYSVADVFFAPKYQGADDISKNEWHSLHIGFDLAILRINEDVQDIQPVKLAEISNLSTKHQFTTVGYPQMLYNLYQPVRYGSLLNCKYVSTFENILIDTSCEATPGQSGGALLVKDLNSLEWKLMGITTIMMPNEPINWVRSVYIKGWIDWINGLRQM